MTTVHRRSAFHYAHVFATICEVLHNRGADFAVRNLAAAETYGYLDFVAAIQELDGLLGLGQHIVFLNCGRKLHFLDFDDPLIFAVFAFLPGLLIAILAVIDDLGNERPISENICSIEYIIYLY